MAFRADESAKDGLEKAKRYLINPKHIDESELERSYEALLDIVDECGPVVEAYPTWHPLVCNHPIMESVTAPSDVCGYVGLDHTVHFRNGFVTCPYGGVDEVIAAVDALPPHPIATIGARELDVKLYAMNARPVLVTCKWDRPMELGGTIPLSVAAALLLEREIPCWRSSSVAESWDTMRTYFIGEPCGAASSLFLSQRTVQALKKIWESIIYTGMYGDIKVRR